MAQAGTGDSFADFLLGFPATGQVIGLPLLPYRFTQVNPYIQDTWKVTRSFTLNYGIAWFLSTNPRPVGFADSIPTASMRKPDYCNTRRWGRFRPKCWRGTGVTLHRGSDLHGSRSS